MPTGYTCYIEDGTIKDGKEFLLKCARAFGACVEMRDESFDKEIPEKFEENNYYKDGLERAYSQLEKYSAYTADEAQKEIDTEYDRRQKEYKNGLIKAIKIKENYDRVLSDVKQWNSPTEDHVELKKFAINQIEISTDWDSVSFYEKELAIPKPDAKSWLKDRIDSIKKDIEYFTKHMNEEHSRVDARNQWIKDLRNSL